LTLKTLFVPGPYDNLALPLKGALGPNADLSSLDYWTPSDNASQLAARSEALVLGPGAEAACELASEDGDIRFVQFTGCRQSSLAASALQEKGLTVANAAPAIAPFVAEHTVSLIQAALALAGQRDRPTNELVIGIVGLGNVGIEVARHFAKAGASIVYHDVRTVVQGYAVEVGARRHSLDRMLLNADVVSVHVSDTPHTPGVISDRELKLMKTGAVLVNTSLPEALDEADVAMALASGKLGALALGVMATYPDSQPGPLSGQDKVITELADATDREVVLKAVAAFVVDNLKRVEAGEPPRGLIDPVGFPAVGDPAFWSSRLTPRQP
jgi:phosphoglycerate dehydrogenase-like enzyme